MEKITQCNKEYKQYLNDMDIYTTEATKADIDLEDFLLEKVGIEKDIVDQLMKNWVPKDKPENQPESETKEKKSIKNLDIKNKNKTELPIIFKILLTFLGFGILFYSFILLIGALVNLPYSWMGLVYTGFGLYAGAGCFLYAWVERKWYYLAFALIGLLYIVLTFIGN